eukprot:gb/GEZN01005633.1/.p1 GENE.gb/GEZN01005633.1/~~gb/GEZN01005633.1/.p1  ORF type:complete len:517 (-),score=51.44 gb/GEZN01005633.1/:150-1700(-)
MNRNGRKRIQKKKHRKRGKSGAKMAKEKPESATVFGSDPQGPLQLSTSCSHSRFNGHQTINSPPSLSPLHLHQRPSSRLVQSSREGAPSRTFWLGNEEPAHVKQILNAYCIHTGLSTQRPLHSRSPLHFIGCVKRLSIPPKTLVHGEKRLDKVETLDFVALFQRENVPIGLTQTLIRREVYRTEWDEEQGLPFHTTQLDAQAAKDLYYTLEQHHSHSTLPVPYYLYALPIFSTEEEFEYMSTTSEREVGYASSVAHCLHESLLQLGRSTTPPSAYAYDPASAEETSPSSPDSLRRQFSPPKADPQSGAECISMKVIDSPTTAGSLYVTQSSCTSPVPPHRVPPCSSLLTQALFSQGLHESRPESPTSDQDSLRLQSDGLIRQDTPASVLSPSDQQSHLSTSHHNHLLFPPPVGSTAFLYSFPPPSTSKSSQNDESDSDFSPRSPSVVAKHFPGSPNHVLSKSMEEDKLSILETLGGPSFCREEDLFGLDESTVTALDNSDSDGDDFDGPSPFDNGW